MVVCKFFLQGTCRYGESCRFEHQMSNNSGYQQNPIMRQKSFTGNANSGGNTKTVDLNTLIQSVTADMVNAEKGGQWLLSTYAPFKEKANYSGFEDESFEEVRLGYYNAQTTGNLDQYLQSLQLSQQHAATLIKSLQNPSQEAITAISNIYNCIPSRTAHNSVFGNAKPANNIFLQTNVQNQGLFLQNQQTNQSNTLKSTGSIFSQPNPQSQGLFNQQSSNQTSSIFSGSAQNQTLFNGAMQQNNIFNKVQTGNAPMQSTFRNVQQNNIFVPPQNQPNQFPFSNTFQTSNVPFNQLAGQQPQIAVAPPPSNPSNIFATQTQNNPAQSIFTPQPSNSGIIFPLQASAPATASTANIQTNLQMQVNGQSSSQNLFINNNKPTEQKVQSSNIFGGQNNNTNEIDDVRTYSKLEDLTEDEIKSFESPQFEFGKIPIKPPTKEMCLV